MTAKRTLYSLLAAFLLGNFVLIFIQFNSADNISSLIEGNEKLMREYQAGSNLKELMGNVLLVENKIRGSIHANDSLLIADLEEQMSEVKSGLNDLQPISDNDSSIAYINRLNELVNQKLQFNRQVLDSFQLAGQAIAESMIANPARRQLTDSIVATARRLETVRRGLLLSVTSSIDSSGKKALRFSTILIVLVLATGVLLFWYIINTIRKQNSLIRQLNISEQNVRQAAAAKENFLANMSHEIRTPLNAILGFTNLLQHKALDKETSSYVQTIKTSGDQLLALVNDILDLSKAEAGMMRLQQVPFSLNQVVPPVVALFESKAAEKNLTLHVQLGDNLPGIVMGDANRLTQVLMNLLSNAIKFTEAGRIELSVKNEGLRDGKYWIQFIVSDTGIGIDATKQAVVFERFEQAEDFITRKYGGSGLGLSIVKNLVALQGGTIHLESKKGAGSRFFITLPFAPAQQNETAQPLINPASKQLLLPPLKVLVVEDNEINQSLMRELLKRWQLEYHAAYNGHEAIRFLRHQPVDAVLMDIQMPELDGYTATQIIRNDLRLAVPVIAMTAHVRQGEKERCLQAGMNGYLSKPVQEEDLYALLQVLHPSTNDAVLTDRERSYQYIDLSYLESVSSGNTDYEKEVTQQFLEALPKEISGINEAWSNGNETEMRQRAHNLKTTISVMGLSDRWQAWLDALELKPLTTQEFSELMAALQQNATKVMEEAKHFYQSLQQKE